MDRNRVKAFLIFSLGGITVLLVGGYLVRDTLDQRIWMQLGKLDDRLSACTSAPDPNTLLCKNPAYKHPLGTSISNNADGSICGVYGIEALMEPACANHVQVKLNPPRLRKPFGLPDPTRLPKTWQITFGETGELVYPSSATVPTGSPTTNCLWTAGTGPTKVKGGDSFEIQVPPNLLGLTPPKDICTVVWSVKSGASSTIYYEHFASVDATASMNGCLAWGECNYMVP